MLLSIAGQESAFKHRYQITAVKDRKGPARGYWQFERMGGVAGVMQHRSSSAKAKALAAFCDVPWDTKTIWERLEVNDNLAVGFARLLLWTDPRPLPLKFQEGWNYYIRNWRPGKPHPDKWRGYWQSSHEALEKWNNQRLLDTVN